MKIRGILELFGIRRPNPFDVAVDEAVRRYQRTHYQQVDCLVCQALLRGADPMKLEIVRENRGLELVTWVRERSDEKEK